MEGLQSFKGTAIACILCSEVGITWRHAKVKCISLLGATEEVQDHLEMYYYSVFNMFDCPLWGPAVDV